MIWYSCKLHSYPSVHPNRSRNCPSMYAEGKSSLYRPHLPFPLRILKAYDSTDFVSGSTNVFGSASSVFATTPTMLYRFEKNVIQSLSVCCSFSGRSSQSGRTSSAFVEVIPRARDASWPANTVLNPGEPGTAIRGTSRLTVVGAAFLVHLVS